MISHIQHDINPDPTELTDLLSGLEEIPEVRIILIAEEYDPEVIITSNWLHSVYQLDITAYSLSLHKDGDQYLVEVRQLFPLKALSELYSHRGHRRRVTIDSEALDWEDILPKLKYEFAQEAIQLCRKIKEGDPGRRRFGGLRRNWDGFEWISVSMRQNYMNVYIKGKFDGYEENIKTTFGNDIEFSHWRDGLSVLVRNRKQFEALVSWLKLKESS